MTRKDYQAIADAIRLQVQEWPKHGTHWNSLYAVAQGIANVMYADNPRFDRSRFLNAC